MHDALELFSESLKDKVAVISGGSSGIGLATAQMLLNANCRVYSLDIKVPSKELGKNFIHKTGDVTDEKDVLSFFNSVFEVEKKVDFMINNAGTYIFKDLEEMNSEDFYKLVDVNIKGCFLMARGIIPHFKKNRIGNIVNVASVSGQRFERGHPLYNMTKGAILAMTKSLAIDLADYNVRVNSVSPGEIRTELNDYDISVQAKSKGVSFEEFERTYNEEFLLKRRGEPDEVASVILFLLSGLSSYINGEDIIITGGGN